MMTTNRIVSKVRASTPVTGVRPAITLITGGSPSLARRPGRVRALDAGLSSTEVAQPTSICGLRPD
jgi:hypothetical protein